MNKDEEIEKEIIEKGLVAPRITIDDINNSIKEETFTVLPSRRTMICELTLRNGFTVRGESSCVSIENFDYDLGKKISKDDARNKIWVLEAYLLKERLFEK